MPVGKGFQDQQLPEVPHYRLPYVPFSSCLHLYSAYGQKGHIQEPRQEDQLQNEPDSDIPLLSFSQKDLLYFCLPCIRRNLFPEQDVHWGSCPRLQDTVVSQHLQMVQYMFSCL